MLVHSKNSCTLFQDWYLKFEVGIYILEDEFEQTHLILKGKIVALTSPRLGQWDSQSGSCRVPGTGWG